MATPFSDIYNRFLGKITDDMYFVWTKEDTEKDLRNILLDAIPGFEFPSFPLYDYTLVQDEDPREIIHLDSENLPLPNQSQYNCTLSSEEINILALLMMNVWLQRQMTSIENTRMKYSGSDFKMTSQGNFLNKLIELKKEAERLDRHYQRLYKRRKMVSRNGAIMSNWSTVMEKSALDEY